MTTLWSLIFILNSNRTLRLGGRGLKRQRARLMPPNKKTTLECQTGISKECNKQVILHLELQF